VAEKDQARAGTDRLVEPLEHDFLPVLRGDLQNLDLHTLAPTQEKGWHQDRRVLEAAGNHLVALAPLHAVEHDVEPLGGVLDEGDLLRGRTDEVRQGPPGPAQELLLFLQHRPRRRALGVLVLHPLPNLLGDDPGRRPGPAGV